MKNKNNKKIFIIIGCILLAIATVIVILNVNKSNNNIDMNNSNNIQNTQILSEEDRKNQEIEEKEKQYKENARYQCFKDDTFKIRFYYDNENLKYGSMIAQGGNKLALQEKSGDSMFSYSTNEMTGEYDKNQLVADFINAQVNSGFTINENKDITISKITPIEARYVECLTGNIIIKNYLIYTDKGLAKFVIGGNIGIDSPAINEILDTIIIE